jgi:hypothetical protein
MLHAHGHVQVQQPVLPLEVPVLQQHLLPLDLLVPALKQTLLLVCVSIADWGLWTRLFSNSMCCLWTCVSSLTDCAASGLVCSRTACAASGRVSLLWRPVLLLNVSLLCAFPGRVRVSVLQQSVMSSEGSGLQVHMLVLQMCVFVQQQPILCQEVYGLPSVLSVCKSLCCTWTCLFTRAFVLHLRVCLQELCASNGRVWLQEFCDAPGCVCLRELCAAPGRACLQAFLLHLHVRVCLQELCDAPGRVCQQECSPGCNCRCSVENLFGLFRFVSKQFCLFRLFRYRFETPKQTEIFCFWFHETNRNRSCFCLFRFEPKFIFVCFEDTLGASHTMCWVSPRNENYIIYRERGVGGRFLEKLGGEMLMKSQQGFFFILTKANLISKLRPWTLYSEDLGYISIFYGNILHYIHDTTNLCLKWTKKIHATYQSELERSTSHVVQYLYFSF